MIAPFRIVMPIDKAHQDAINLMDETPHPIYPKRIKSLNRWTANPWLTPVHIGSEPSHNPLRHCLIHATILLEVDAATNPIVVRFVPDAPIPIPHHLAAPLLYASPHHIGALVGEPAYGTDIVERPTKSGKRHERDGPDIEDSLYIRCKIAPIGHWIRRVLIEKEDTDNTGIQVTQPSPNALSLWP